MFGLSKIQQEEQKEFPLPFNQFPSPVNKQSIKQGHRRPWCSSLVDPKTFAPLDIFEGSVLAQGFRRSAEPVFPQLLTLSGYAVSLGNS